MLGCGALALADESLARFVPADVGLYVELRSAEDLLLPLIEPQLWITLADLTGQPARLDESELWRRRVKQTVGLTPEQAIRNIFSNCAALASESWTGSGDAIVLGRASQPARDVIRGWPTQPLPSPGRASVYRLPNNVGLVVLDDVLLFGDRTSTRVFPEALRLMETQRQARLSDDPTFRNLRARVPFEPDGLVFARLGADRPTSRPTSTSAPTSAATTSPTTPSARTWLPRLLDASQNVLLAMKRDGRALHFSAVGDAPARGGSPSESMRTLVESLPADTLTAWAGRVDYDELLRTIQALPPQHALRIFCQLHERLGTLEQFLHSLDSDVCLALGSVDREATGDATPPVPALALIIPVRDRAKATTEFRELMHSSLSIVKLLLLKRTGELPFPPLQTHVAGDLVVEVLDLSPLLERVFGPAAKNTLQITWTVDEDVLVIATHLDWLVDVVAARHDRQERLSPDVLALHGLVGSIRDSLFIAQTGAIADLGSEWIEYLQATAPDTLSESWWRSYQPGGPNTRLGVQVTADNQRGRLAVQSVTPGSPADGVIREGDVIVGVNRRRFATSQPVNEVLDGVESRPDARWVDLLVERDRIVRVHRVVLPFVDPVTVLQRLIAIGQLVNRVAYAELVSDELGARGHLLIELRERAPTLRPASSSSTTTPAATPTLR